MRRVKISVISALMLCLIPVSSWSIQIGAGAVIYYSEWVPDFIGQNDNIDVDPALLAGFAFSIRFFDRFMLGAQGMFSFLDNTAGYTVNLPSTDVDIKTLYTREESDLSLTYLLNDRINLFAGYKRLNFDVTELQKAYASNGYDAGPVTIKNQFHIHGPGAGAAFRFPLYESLGMSLSTSVIYFYMKYYSYYLYESGTDVLSDHADYDYRGLGNNTTVTFSYYIDSISTVLSLGARCQVIRYLDSDSAPDMSYDLNYGVTLSAMYYF